MRGTNNLDPLNYHIILHLEFVDNELAHLGSVQNILTVRATAGRTRSGMRSGMRY